MARLVMGELSPKAGTGTKEFAISSDGWDMLRLVLELELGLAKFNFRFKFRDFNGGLDIITSSCRFKTN
jgi:hypothetical protein